MKDRVYLAITNDKYELPIAIFENAASASNWIGCTIKHFYSYISKQQVNKKYNVKFIKVLLEEENK